MAKVIKKINDQLEMNNLWDPYQSAYRSHHSCETAVLSIINYVYASIDWKEVWIAVLLDMSAAFDTVDHDILLQKPENLGIRNDTLYWLK
jgi:hypothetical protein